MGQRQHEILGERVPDGESDLIEMMAAEEWIGLEELQGVVHPPHVPLQAEPQTAQIHGPATPVATPWTPRRWSGVPGMITVDGFVQRLQEVARVQILVATESIRDPLASLAAVVQVEHGCHRVHAQRIGAIGLQPEERVAAEEIAHLGPAVIEDRTVPLRVMPWRGSACSYRCVPSKNARPC